MGNQKLTNRQPMTPQMAIVLGVPNPTRMPLTVASTTPRPPGVRGMAAAMLATPYAITKATGLTQRPKAPTNKNSDPRRTASWRWRRPRTRRAGAGPWKAP